MNTSNQNMNKIETYKPIIDSNTQIPFGIVTQLKSLKLLESQSEKTTLCENTYVLKPDLQEGSHCNRKGISDITNQQKTQAISININDNSTSTKQYKHFPFELIKNNCESIIQPTPQRSLTRDQLESIISHHKQPLFHFQNHLLHYSNSQQNSNKNTTLISEQSGEDLISQVPQQTQRTLLLKEQEKENDSVLCKHEISEENEELSEDFPRRMAFEMNNNNNNNEEFSDDNCGNQNPNFIGMSSSQLHDYNRIKDIVNFIVNNLDKNDEASKVKRDLIAESDYFKDKRTLFLSAFDSLLIKFKNLKKTKEEKTKFCMRKAFRYLFGVLKRNYSAKINLKEANEICMKHYFSKHVHDSKFILPFRRNSSIKTMNSAFLKKVFSSEKFCHDYRGFLAIFDTLAQEDNSKKIDQLAYYILPLFQNNQINKIGALRRLPWTLSLLESTKKLAIQLLLLEEQYSPKVLSDQTIPSQNQSSVVKKEEGLFSDNQSSIVSEIIKSEEQQVIQPQLKTSDFQFQNCLIDNNSDQFVCKPLFSNSNQNQETNSNLSKSLFEQKPQITQTILPNLIDIPSGFNSGRNTTHLPCIEFDQNLLNSVLNQFQEMQQLNLLQSLLPFQQLFQLTQMQNAYDPSKQLPLLTKQTIHLTPPNTTNPQPINYPYNS